ncbi:hypothetical protein XELAEV_18046490mg [Xenopus laevis]|uniref:Uncharacterized protein n=1 Tax=Xenopus laevis TaxID=8355 RepID=A0A974BT17_XENLA|nr:hypothetical protein XELAEV_18046490mg [Xenopus laevis]
MHYVAQKPKATQKSAGKWAKGIMVGACRGTTLSLKWQKPYFLRLNLLILFKWFAILTLVHTNYHLLLVF